MINVTKTFLPPYSEYMQQLKRAWDKVWITNNGELVLELEDKLKTYLDVDHLIYASNGTVVLQLALKALGITGEVITTPFSYVATTNVLIWENCKPVFVDINPKNFCIDETKIEAAITPATQAILATHVYGYPCHVEAIERIAKKHGLYVIYDAAHAFGTSFNGTSIMNYGDISTCSFHATKVFHTVEGGCLITPNAQLADKVTLYRQFGHLGEEHISVGINGKNSEMHAAMGLCNLNYIDEILANRKECWIRYAEGLSNTDFQLLELSEDVKYNYAYFPVVCSSEEALLDLIAVLKSHEIVPRRYFNPSLNTLPYLDYQPCPIAESISKRVLCLPLYYGLEISDQNRIIEILNDSTTKSRSCA